MTNYPSFYTCPNLAEIDQVAHGFFTRNNGTSTGLYATRNCGFGSHDDPNNVRKNLDLCAKDIGLDANKLSATHQVHGKKIEVIDRPIDWTSRPKADGLVTTKKRIGLCIATADCVAILAVDPINNVIGAAHTGWRGTLEKIPARLIDVMVKQGAQKPDIVVALSPSLSQKNFEVGAEFVDTFIQDCESNAQFFQKLGPKDTPHFDNMAYIQKQLTEKGLAASQISALDICTYDQEDAFYSYRRATHRGEPDYGRQISIIGLR